MAYRFPNQAFQPNQGIPNRGLSVPGMDNNQGFQPNQSVPNRGMPSYGMNSKQGIQSNQGMSHRGMPGPEMSTNQGFQPSQNTPNRGMPVPGMNSKQGFQPNQIMSNRGMPGPGMNNSQGFQSNQSMSNRGMPGPGMNNNQGFQSNQSISNRGMPGPGMNNNQGFQSNQSISNRGMPGPGMNNNQGFQSNQSMSNRGMPGYEMNSKQGFPSSQSMPNRGMLGQETNTNQGFQPNQNMPNRGMPGQDINTQEMYNQPVSNQGMPQGNVPMSHARAGGNMMQGNEQFQMQQGMQFDGNAQGPMTSVGMQQGTMPPSSMQQAPIVQHVMIPVPVPVGTEIPPHLLRPQIITTAGPGLPNQGNFTGQQSQGQFPVMQGQGQMTGLQGQFPNTQGQFQGHGQTSNMTGQSNLPGLQGQGQFQNPKHGFQTVNSNASVRGSGEDDLSYYMGQESRNSNRPRVGESSRGKGDHDFKQNKPRMTPDEVYALRVAEEEEKRRRDQERKFQAARIAQEREDERKRRERSRSQSSGKHSFTSEHVERSRQDLYLKARDTSSFNREQVDTYRRHSDQIMKNQENRNTEQFVNKQRNFVNESHERFEREQKSERQMQTEFGRVNRIESFERNQRPNRLTEFDQNYSNKRQGDSQRYQENENYESGQSYSRHGNADYKIISEDVRKVQHSETNEYRGKERIESDRHSGALLYTDGNREDLEISNTNDYRDTKRNLPEKRSEAILFTDRKISDFEDNSRQDYRNKQRNELEGSSNAILLKDGKREDLECRGIERYDREKRKHSPVSSERSSRKIKRDYSPVSESKSHGELKIHISDRGRWIESDKNLSPVSDDVDRFENERKEVGRNIYIRDEIDFEQNSLDGAEMISDSESYIGDIRNDKIRIQNLSPVSQQSSRYESQRIDDRSHYATYEGMERISPSRSCRSRQSDDRRSRSHRSRHSEDSQRKRRHSQGSNEFHGHISDQRNQQSNRSSIVFQLHVPDLCLAHNQKGCHLDGCENLHICKFYIIDMCKFGEFCTKGHDMFKGHSYDILSKINPGFRHSNVTAEQIKLILKKRISKVALPKELEHRLTTYRIVRNETEKSPLRELQQTVNTHKTDLREKVKSNRIEFQKKEISPKREPENVVAVDPSFDARNYAPGNFVKIFDEKEKLSKSPSKTKCEKKENDNSPIKIGTKTSDKERKNTINERGSERKGQLPLQKDNGGNPKSSRNENEKESYKKKDNKSRQKNEHSQERNRKQLKTDTDKVENMLSPVSGDEDDWEKYEKYEQISDDGMSVKDEKEDGLDNVSSDDSSIEQVQVNRSVDSFPLPTPENIAVPIGMNDPLVFNRPLKNNPQSYIGPLNRPPPMFPIAADRSTPLFPVVPQNQNLMQSNVGTVMPGFAGISGPVTGHFPNHLPSPDFMKQVIQNLPTYKIEPMEQKNVFKNDNNPAATETDSPKKKIKSDKVERDPELKETIKKLWKFPHKGIVNMSIIEFVTETEAYKEEFIAEIVKILVTLQLPYVTMKKLLSVIKEKVSINIKSETDMRKILEMYPNNFKILEMVDSDDESDDSDTKKNVQIKANIGIGFCEKHGFLPFAIGKCECNALHLCKFYFLSDCPIKHCKFGHKLKTDHNVAVLKQHKLHRLTGEEILTFLADDDNRNKETIPSICKYYVREKGCYKGDNTDYDSICHSLHLCSYILKGRCMNRECDRSHSIRDKQPLSLLKKYGLDPNELGDEKVLQMLGEKCIENEKGRKFGSFKQRQQTKGSAKSRAASGNNKTNYEGVKSSPAEGLPIVSHSETRVSSKYFVQNFKAPAVCKFYQNAMGCRKKDWGAEGKCFFLHICQHYVAGDCNYGDKCKRSHDLFSGQAAEILQKYNFDIDNMTASDILKRLNSNSGAPVELPKAENSSLPDNEKIEITIDCVGEPDEIDLSNFEIPKHVMEIETRVNVEENDGFSSETEGAQKKVKGLKDTSIAKSTKQNTTSFESCNIEDVIKHIMEHNKVDKK